MITLFETDTLVHFEEEREGIAPGESSRHFGTKMPGKMQRSLHGNLDSGRFGHELDLFERDA